MLVSVSDMNLISYRLTQDQPIWKKKKPNNNKVLFSLLQASSIPYCFEDNLQPYHEAEMHIRSGFVILLTWMYFYGLLACLKLNKDLY